MTKCDGAVVPDYSHSHFLTVSGSTFNAPLEWQNRAAQAMQQPRSIIFITAGSMSLGDNQGCPKLDTEL